VNEVNSQPSISFQSDWTVQAQTLLSLSATASDPDLPAQMLTFSLESGAPAGSAIDPSTGAFTWTPSAAFSGTNLITLRVADNASPPASASRVLRVVVLPLLTAGINVTGDLVSINCNTVSGRTYRVEYKTDLTDTNWTQASTNKVADSNTITFQDSVGPNTQRFYRVLQVD
jgi:hypothetical protein